MPFFALALSAELSNVTRLGPSDIEEFRWHLKFRCQSCEEVSEKWHWAVLTEGSSIDLSSSRGAAQFAEKCPGCGRVNTLRVVEKSFKEYSIEKNGQFQHIARFECRGMVPIEFKPSDGWHCYGEETDTHFDDIDLSEDWAEYDEKAQLPVEINNVRAEFVKVKDR
ncbi:unnamed protein product, partial [Mesorhabditis spiculigera]